MRLVVLRERKRGMDEVSGVQRSGLGERSGVGEGECRVKGGGVRWGVR